jgi:2-polyprenylphenol 6-hydroxylase
VFDVVIVGGGPAGACLGALLVRGAGGARALSVALLEPHAATVVPPAANAVPDARVVAVSRSSERILLSAGAWPHIEGPRLAPYERMRIWHESVAPDSASVLTFDAADVAEPNLGYILESRLLQSALLRSFSAGGGQLEPAALVSLEVTQAQVRVVTTAGELCARLVVGADGAHSVLREAAGLSAETRAYGQSAIVATVATARGHAATAYQRFLARGTLAFLPLFNGESSIVWSADDALAAELAALDDAAFAAALERAADFALGTTRLAGARQSFPLRRLSAPRYVAPRVALIGDAAHVVHPLAGQGVNLGLLDAAALAEQLGAAVARREDVGALGVLRAYERWRKSEVAGLAAAIDAFDRLLAHGTGPLARLAQQGLAVVGRSEELRRFFIRRALGLSGELPQAARLRA